MSQPPIEEEPTIVTGWVDAVAAAEADAMAYTDEQVPIVAGRMVPRNMDRAPLVEDGTDLLDGTGWNQYDPVTGDLVQMWRWDGAAWQALDMAAQMIPVLDIGSATVGDLTGGRINVTEGPIVAGAPGGARVEITGDGLHAYDATGTETATIQGGEGVFVGGEFRTSDTLPGQVTLSDGAYVSSFDGITRPGISIEPENSQGYASLPGMGPDNTGVSIDGGKLTTGESSQVRLLPNRVIVSTRQADGGYGGLIQADSGFAQMHTYRADGTAGGVIRTAPEESLMRTYRADGTTGGVIQTSPGASLMRTYSGDGSESGWARVRPEDAELAYVASDNTYFSRIKADATEAHLYTRAGGTTRYLSVDADGVWVKTNKSGSWKHYNLEETAQDSGWQAIPLASGITGAGSPAWRNKGGVIYFRGTVDAAWIDGWNEVATNLPTEMRPEVRVIRTSPSTGGANLLFRMESDGRLRFYRPGGGAVQGDMSGLFYPLG